TEVFHFLQLGRYLERIDMLSRILGVTVRQAHGESGGGPHLLGARWSALLRSCSAHEAFLRSSHEEPGPRTALRFLVLDPDFPRAVRFCLSRCLESLREIAGGDDDGYRSEAERHLGRLDGDLRYLDPAEILQRGLPAFLASIQETCNKV